MASPTIKPFLHSLILLDGDELSGQFLDLFILVIVHLVVDKLKVIILFLPCVQIVSVLMKL